MGDVNDSRERVDERQ